jgi:hypothetical protein
MEEPAVSIFRTEEYIGHIKMGHRYQEGEDGPGVLSKPTGVRRTVKIISAP